MALIGYIAEKTNFGRGEEKEQKNSKPTKLKEEINDNWLEDEPLEQLEEIPISDLKPVNEYASEDINPDLGIQEEMKEEIPLENITANVETEEVPIENKETEDNEFEDAIVEPIPTINPVIFTDPVVLDKHLKGAVDGKNMYDELYKPADITPTQDFSFNNETTPEETPIMAEIDPSLTEPLPEFKPIQIENVEDTTSEESLNEENDSTIVETDNNEVKEIDENKPVEEVVEDVWNF